MLNHSRKIGAASLPLFLLFAAGAGAQANQDQLAGFGGSMHALAEQCGASTPAELKASRAKQRGEAVKRGASTAQFDAAFDAGYAKSKTKLATASAAERAKACAQAEQMKQMGERMNQGR